MTDEQKEYLKLLALTQGHDYLCNCGNCKRKRILVSKLSQKKVG